MCVSSAAAHAYANDAASARASAADAKAFSGARRSSVSSADASARARVSRGAAGDAATHAKQSAGIGPSGPPGTWKPTEEKASRAAATTSTTRDSVAAAAAAAAAAAPPAPFVSETTLRGACQRAHAASRPAAVPQSSPASVGEAAAQDREASSAAKRVGTAASGHPFAPGRGRTNRRSRSARRGASASTGSRASASAAAAHFSANKKASPDKSPGGGPDRVSTCGSPSASSTGRIIDRLVVVVVE